MQERMGTIGGQGRMAALGGLLSMLGGMSMQGAASMGRKPIHTMTDEEARDVLANASPERMQQVEDRMDEMRHLEFKLAEMLDQHEANALVGVMALLHVAALAASDHLPVEVIDDIFKIARKSALKGGVEKTLRSIVGAPIPVHASEVDETPETFLPDAPPERPSTDGQAVVTSEPATLPQSSAEVDEDEDEDDDDSPCPDDQPGCGCGK